MRYLADDAFFAAILCLVFLIEHSFEHGVVKRIMIIRLHLVVGVLFTIVHDLLELRATHVTFLFVEVVPHIVEYVEYLALNSGIERMTLFLRLLIVHLLVLLEASDGYRSLHLFLSWRRRHSLRRCHLYYLLLLLNTVAMLIDLTADGVRQLALLLRVSDLMSVTKICHTLLGIFIGMDI